MKPNTMALSIGLACVAATAAWAQEPRPGKYRTTATTDAPGMAAKPITDEDCITKKEFDDGLTRMGIEKDTQCKVLDMKRALGQISYRLECVEDGRKMTSDVKGTLGTDAFDFTIVMAGLQPGGKPVTTRVQGKRVGECK